MGAYSPILKYRKSRSLLFGPSKLLFGTGKPSFDTGKLSFGPAKQ
ncbi:hypothetical protein GCWU000325_02445 [Alloprevotella tannerae ATCC 51259]|uniref:Uncharacterized protein n=1 Tax=Alloprevotella tannerae ATCC 51259 TaxID=626522 RepID=C9LJN2_9BACT|nr:hypothetical protein GCWU000325_02445 [Alloprevotella tannerae ATCC 51259]